MGSPFVSAHPRSPFASTSTGPQVLVDTAGLYEFGYRRAPLPLSSLSTGSSGSAPPFGVIPIPLARNMLELRLDGVPVESEGVKLLGREGGRFVRRLVVSVRGSDALRRITKTKKAEGIGKANAEGRVEGEGSRRHGRRREAKREGKDRCRRRERIRSRPTSWWETSISMRAEDVVDPSALDLDLHFILDSTLPWTSTSTQQNTAGRGSYLVFVGIGVCAAVLKVLVGWDMELIGEEEQEVALVGYTFWIWFQAYDFDDFYDRFLTGADEELNK